MSNKKSWKIKNNEIKKGLEQYTSNPLLCKLLANRGIEDAKSAHEFLNPKEIKLISPFVFCDMEKAVQRIKKAVEDKEKILIWGDFDADGVTSSALLYKTFAKIGANFTYFIPNRKDHGHGLNSGELIKLISKEKIKLVITVDCGISNVKEADFLKSFKVDLIITDHHKAGENIPFASALIDATVKGGLKEDLNIREIQSLCNLAGVGVVYKLALALQKEFPSLKEIEEELLCLCAVGTISDVVPLLGENRTLVARGLELINKGLHKGILKLFKECGKEKDITSTDIAFILTPRINAMGRLADVKAPFELLVQDNPEVLTPTIEMLNNYNKIRQTMCDAMFCEIREKAKKETERAVILFNPDWHIGIIGIVAARVVEETCKPAFLMTQGEDGQIRCSIRSPKGYNVYEILDKLKENFLGFGGHALAGGFSFDSNKISFEKMKSEILKVFKELYSDILPDNSVEVDCEIKADILSEQFLKSLKSLEPFGEQNPAPLFCIKDVKYLSHKFVGKENNHLKLECEKENEFLHCVWWGKNRFSIPKTPFDIAFAPRLNIFNGIAAIQLELVDISSAFEEAEVKIYDHRAKENILPQIDEYLGRDGICSDIYAKKYTTLEKIKKYENIFKKVYQETNAQNIIFFDYPASRDEFENFLKLKKPLRIHLMKEDFEENMEVYLKNLIGMLKFSNNKKEGEIDIVKMAEFLGVTHDFIQVALEIFEKEKGIEILNENKIKFIMPVSIEKFKSNTMYEILSEEFENIVNFKNFIMNTAADNIKEMAQF